MQKAPQRDTRRGAKRQKYTVGTAVSAPRVPLARERFTARDDEHSDCDGNGCCDGFAPHFPHPRQRGRACARGAGKRVHFFVMPFSAFSLYRAEASLSSAFRQISAKFYHLFGASPYNDSREGQVLPSAYKEELL